MSQLPEGKCGTVIEVESCGDVYGRLQDLGLVQGTSVCCLRKAPSGSPIIYNIRGAMVALRTSDAEKICVEVRPWD